MGTFLFIKCSLFVQDPPPYPLYTLHPPARTSWAPLSYSSCTRPRLRQRFKPSSPFGTCSASVFTSGSTSNTQSPHPKTHTACRSPPPTHPTPQTHTHTLEYTVLSAVLRLGVSGRAADERDPQRRARSRDQRPRCLPDRRQLIGRIHHSVGGIG